MGILLLMAMFVYVHPLTVWAANNIPCRYVTNYMYMYMCYYMSMYNVYMYNSLFTCSCRSAKKDNLDLIYMYYTQTIQTCRHNTDRTPDALSVVRYQLSPQYQTKKFEDLARTHGLTVN